MDFAASKVLPLLPLLVMGCLAAASSQAGTKVTFDPEKRDAPERKEDQPAFHRKLWEGSFDRAGDHSGSVAKQLEGGLEFNCNEQFGFKPAAGTTAARPANWAALNDCRSREAASRGFAKDAKSIQGQQKVMSVVSKVSDVAALAAVGGVIYGELGVKKPNQASTYESAAKIQRMAGQASYVTGATDLTLGAYAFVAQKRKLEEMQKTLNGKGASTDNGQLNSSLANAVEATKKAAYSHMMYGAGKMAAGYASMWLAKRTEKAAESMNTIQELREQIEIEKIRAASGTPVTIMPAWPAGASPPAPYYQNNNPVFTMPSSTSNSGLAPLPVSPTPIASGGASIAMPGRNTASTPASAKGPSGGGGGGTSAGDSSGASAPPPEETAAQAKSHKDALGSFETSLTGGLRSFGGSSAAPAKDEAPNMAALLGGTDSGGHQAATGLSPTQMMSAALEGTEGTEQGSMAGVNGKSETSLFAITKEKLNKMFQVGNVGIPKELEVKN